MTQPSSRRRIALVGVLVVAWVVGSVLGAAPRPRPAAAAPLFQLLSVLEEASTEYGFSETRQVATPEERASVQTLIDAIANRISRSKYISPDYQHVDGTSFASPIIASVAAQMLEAIAGFARPNTLQLQSQQVIQNVRHCLSQGLVHDGTPLPAVRKSQMAALIGRPVSFSIQMYCPLGLVSMNT